MIDIGRDLQRAYDEGYKQGRYDEKVETEMSLPSVEQTHALRTETHACDLISRNAALALVVKAIHGTDSEEIKDYLFGGLRKELWALPSAQPERQHGRIFNGIVVEYPSISTYPEYEGKPYFLIKYTENGQGLIGYGTYNPEVLSEYLKEYFMPSAQPEIIRCKDCKYYIDNRCYKIKALDDLRGSNDFCSYAERRADEWLVNV